MALKYFDNVRHAVTTTGVTNITFGAVPAGYQSLTAAGAADGDSTPYELREGDEWEVGFLPISGTVSTGTRNVIASSNAGAEIDLQGAATLSGVMLADLLPYFSTEVKSGAGPHAAGVHDRGKTFVVTADAELDFAAAADLGDRWFLHVMARGGTVTLDPDASELIEGKAKITIPDGGQATINCTGTTFYADRSEPVTAVPIVCFLNSQACAVGDDAPGFYFDVPLELDGRDLIGVGVSAGAAGVTGTMDVQVHNLDNDDGAADMLSTKTTVASAANYSRNGVVDTDEGTLQPMRRVHTADRLRIDYDAIHTTPASGSNTYLFFEAP